MIMSFRKSILYFLVISLLVTIIVGGIGSYFMLKNAADITYQYDNTTEAALYLEKAKSNFWRAQSLMLQMALDKDPGRIRENHDKALALYKNNDELLSLYAQTESSGSEEDALYAALVEKRGQFHALNAHALELDILTTSNEAIAEFNRYNNEVMLPVLNEFMDALDALNAYVLNVAALANVQNKKSSDAAFMTIVGIIAAAVIILLAAGYYFASGILRAISEETDFATAIAEKNFTVKLNPHLLTRKDEFGAMARALETMRDNLMRLIGELSASNEAAKQASRHKSVFLSRMSHEIRTPLNAIIGMTYIAKKAKDPEARNDSLNKITTSSAHLLGLINDILDMSKIEAGKFELIEEEFGLEKLLMNVYTVASAKADEKEQSLLVTLEKGLSSRYIGDDLRLSQILTNILGNACKFTPQKGVIRLTVSCPERNSLWSLVRFTIEDNGIGMTQEQIGRLFSPFEQADGGTSRQFGGTGLGLAICDKIAKLMDGHIQVESEFGKGSAFIVTVKLKNSEQYEPAKLDPSINARHTRVMVVDKSEEAREFFESLFRELNIAAVTADNTDSAFQMLRESKEGSPFNIVFLDWDSLGEEGAALVKKIKAEFTGQVIVVLVSSSRFADIEDKAVDAGVNRFLAKPIFPSTVVNLINEILGAPASQTAKPSSEIGSFRGSRLLLVEDNEINREIVFAYLENTEITVDVAENGAEAVEKYLMAEGAYDLTLMDVHMPVMDGYTASKRIRAEESSRGWRRAVIVAMTANAFKEDIERCIEAGMDDHLAKPMSVDGMMQILRKYLGGGTTTV